MRKILCFVLALTMIFAMSATAFAAGDTLTNEKTSGEATVWYKIGNVANEGDGSDPTDDEMGSTYTVTIPEYIEAAAKNGFPVTQNVTAKNVLLLPKKTLSVTCAYSGELTHTGDGDVKVAYKMQKASSNFNTGDTVLSVPAGTPTQTFDVAIGAILTADPIYAGMYTDTATFTCTVA